LVATRTPSGSRPPNVSPTTRSTSPSPYLGATSMNVIPDSTASRIVAAASSREVEPHS
jgi:hypothetical protein